MNRGWVLTGPGDRPIVLRLESGTTKTVGRTTGADFIVDEALVSRVHCRLTASATGDLMVEDLGSTNGTLVNGRPVDREPLRPGDTLTIGRLDLTVNLAQ